MPPDSPKAAEVREWLSKARGDLAVVETLLKASPPHVAAALFHCQQAAEKSLKAFLTSHDLPFPKTHDLEQLGATCVSIDPDLGLVVDDIESLTPFAWRFRYPGAPDEPEFDEAVAAHRAAGELFGRIVSRISPKPG